MEIDDTPVATEPATSPTSSVPVELEPESGDSDAESSAYVRVSLLTFQSAEDFERTGIALTIDAAQRIRMYVTGQTEVKVAAATSDIVDLLLKDMQSKDTVPHPVALAVLIRETQWSVGAHDCDHLIPVLAPWYGDDIVGLAIVSHVRIPLSVRIKLLDKDLRVAFVQYLGWRVHQAAAYMLVAKRGPRLELLTAVVEAMLGFDEPDLTFWLMPQTENIWRSVADLLLAMGSDDPVWIRLGCPSEETDLLEDVAPQRSHPLRGIPFPTRCGPCQRPKHPNTRCRSSRSSKTCGCCAVSKIAATRCAFNAVCIPSSPLLSAPAR